jgi:uncharacterized protein (TIGR02246 family)
MKAMHPEDLHRLFTEAALRKDLDAMMELYEPEPVSADLEGNALRGTAAIREFLQGFLAVADDMEGRTVKVFATEDLALMSNRWKAAIKTPDGEKVVISSHSAEVARKQPDGSWLFVVDCPLFVPDAPLPG